MVCRTCGYNMAIAPLTEREARVVHRKDGSHGYVLLANEKKRALERRKARDESRASKRSAGV